MTRIRTRSLLRLLMLGLLGVAAGASALPDDQKQPIRISADRAEIDDAAGTATYYGKVRLDQGSLRVTAATLTIQTVEEAVTKITAKGDPDGEPAHYQQLPAAGDPPVVANAATIVYDTSDARIELDGDAHLSQADDRFEGDHISYDLRARKVAASATRDDGRVNFTIRPDRIAPAARPDGKEAPASSEPAKTPAPTSGTD